MVPPPNELETALIEGTYHIFTSEPDATTVNKVRQHVEEGQGLEEGFFTNDEWKQKSKAIIKEYVDKLLDGWKPDSNPEPNSNGAIKRHASSEDEVPVPKRQKLGNTKKNAKAKDGAKPKARGGDTATSKKTKTQPSSTVSRRKSRDTQPDEDEPHEEPDVTNKALPTEASVDETPPSVKSDNLAPGADPSEEEEYSDVIDEAPMPKRNKKELKPKSSKPPKPTVTKKPTATTTDDPQEAEIKKLQSQLVKCGIRKLWHNELKQYKDDSRAKIRHLKKMLADIGMDGRFSEAKAREIKETREILADVDAAQEMNALWGKGSGRRATRGMHKSMALDEDEETVAQREGTDKGGGNGVEEAKNGGGDDDDDEEDASFSTRRKRAHADLAFLGDESESD
ncbi:hypothetical protein E4U38_004893 [Claviceps purpurea]|nr:hypothetical protein E4U38_004893 [Claviceps purpurea]KAG6160431.1 hypothetical protein E4U37_000383 [Claviceps purpurea]KAG6283904.1 hypothetical protein E4U48_003769 [Claviceps purpurea]KAG6307757.1 hypothetical protein E4U45_003618 [Claviceps purpurea]